MRGRKTFLAGAAVVVGVVMLLVACGAAVPTDPAPPTSSITCNNTGDGNVCNVGTGNGTAPAPSASPSASPGAAIACADTHVFVSSFGWTGPATATRPPNQAQPYPLCSSCTSLLTATLKGAQGDVPFAIASGKGRPVWSLDTPSLGVVDIDNSAEGSNNVDGYNLLVKPRAGVGAAATVHVVVNANCVGVPPAADFKYVVAAQ